jgi:integrase
VYNRKDFDRKLVIEERTEVVAKKLTEFLKGYDRFAKTIVFCTDIDHANRMRTAIANCNADLAAENYKYVMQITGDNDEGKRELDNFINPEERYPVIATTSELMTTGVDAQTCKVIVLDAEIKSMTKFKQIVGRGTRINEEFNKLYFTILDFRNVTDLFADKDFDGDPIRVKPVTEETDLSEIVAEEENDHSPLEDELTGEEIEKLINSATQIRNKAIIALLYSSGMRVGELVSLKPEDIYMSTMQVYISKGKNHRDRWTILSERALDLLKEYWRSYPVKREYLFVSLDAPHEPLKVSGVEIMLRAVGKTAGIEAHPHTLRHSFASHMIEQGVPINYVQAMLGHRCLESTQVYIHISNKTVMGIKSPLDHPVKKKQGRKSKRNAGDANES